MLTRMFEDLFGDASATPSNGATTGVPHRRHHVVALMDVVASALLRPMDPDPEVVGDRVRASDGADGERPDGGDVLEDHVLPYSQHRAQLYRDRAKRSWSSARSTSSC